MKTEMIIDKLVAHAEKLMGYSAGQTYESFSENTMLVEACVFNLSQMGELCRIIDESFEKNHSEIPWRQMNGLRNRIVHDYEGVNLKLVWEILSNDIPDLLKRLQKCKLSLREHERE